MEEVLVFVHLVFLGFMSLFAPVNPIGTSIIVDPFLSSLDEKARNQAARKIAIYCFFISIITILVGSWIFKLFGISLPVVRIAGGALIGKMGWDLLNSPETADAKGQREDTREGAIKMDSADDRKKDINDILFFPLSFPMTTGAGAISILLTLSAKAHNTDLEKYFVNLGALLVAVLLVVILIYICYAKTPYVLRRLGKNGEKILNRLSAFIIFCVGLQILVDGVQALMN